MAGVRFPTAERSCLHGTSPRPSLQHNGFIWGVGKQGYEAGHFSPSRTQVNNGGAIPSLPHTSLLRHVQLIKNIPSSLSLISLHIIIIIIEKKSSGSGMGSTQPREYN
jgi:hypothetical protein